MADSDLRLPEELRDDDPRARAETLYDRLGIPPNLFSGVLEGAIVHATGAPPSATTPVQQSAERWAPLGPRNIGGRIRALAQDPSNAAILYAGSAQGGVWKTSDAGNSWRRLGALNQAYPVGTIAIAPKNPQTVYVGTGEPVSFYVSGRGLFQSTNGGATFVQIAGTVAVPLPPPVGALGAADRYSRIVVDPETASRFWAASPTGLWRFEPGVGFVLEPVPVPVAPGDFTDVAVSYDVSEAAPPPGGTRNRLTIFAAVSGVGVFRGTFSRASAPPATVWAAAALAIPAPAATRFRIRLAICRQQPSIVYAAFGTASAAAVQANALFRSANAGVAWSPRAMFPPNAPWYSLAIECHPSKPNVLVGGDLDVYRTSNGGATAWVKILDWQQYDNGDRAQHADQHAVVFDQRDPDHRIWIANDGGISCTDQVPTPPTFRGWRKKSLGIVAAQFNDITVHPTFPFVYGGGLQDNGTYVSFGGPTWYHISGGDGGVIAFEQVNPPRFYCTFVVNAPGPGGETGTCVKPPPGS